MILHMYVNQYYIPIFNKYELAIYYIQMYECLLILSQMLKFNFQELALQKPITLKVAS